MSAWTDQSLYLWNKTYFHFIFKTFQPFFNFFIFLKKFFKVVFIIHFYDVKYFENFSTSCNILQHCDENALNDEQMSVQSCYHSTFRPNLVPQEAENSFRQFRSHESLLEYSSATRTVDLGLFIFYGINFGNIWNACKPLAANILHNANFQLKTLLFVFVLRVPLIWIKRTSDWEP